MTAKANTDHASGTEIELARRLFEALDCGDLTALESMLAANPAAAASRDDSGVCLLAKAYYLRKSDAAKLIARYLAEPDMIEATLLGRVDRVKQIAAADSDAIHRHSPDGFAPLHLACFFNQPAVATWLLENGADANAVSTNPSALCPIHSAAAIGATDIVQTLIDHGADVNRKQSGGFTAIHAAANLGNMKLIEVLQAAGADPYAKTDQGKTAADIAKEKGHTEAAKRIS